jgi:hypothetical protein
MLSMLLFFTFGTLYAAEPSSAARDSYYASGYFIGANVGKAHSSFAGTSASGVASQVYMGYNFNHYIAFSIGYLFLPSLTYSGAKISNNGITLNFKGFYPIGEGFAMYGTVGSAILTAKKTQTGVADAKENATVLTYGGGIDYAFANIGGLHMLLDYSHLDEKKTDTFNVPAQRIASLGVYYQF